MLTKAALASDKVRVDPTDIYYSIDTKKGRVVRSFLDVNPEYNGRSGEDPIEVPTNGFHIRTTGGIFKEDIAKTDSNFDDNKGQLSYGEANHFLVSFLASRALSDTLPLGDNEDFGHVSLYRGVPRPDGKNKITMGIDLSIEQSRKLSEPYNFLSEQDAYGAEEDKNPLRNQIYDLIEGLKKAFDGGDAGGADGGEGGD